MKAQILKIAGVKSEKDFYKKFPTEEAFMAKHGGEFKKAQFGSMTPPVDNSLAGYPGYQPFSLPQAPIAMEGIYNPTIQSGLPTYTPINDNVANKQIVEDNTTSSGMDMFGKSLPMVGGIISGLSALEGEKQKRKQAEQAKKVSEITLQASTTRPEQIERRYVRPEDNVFATSQMFPATGVGTNVLAKKGAKLPKAQQGMDLMSIFGNGNTDVYTGVANGITGNNAGGTIGGSIGQAAGMAAFGPIGGQVGQVAGTLIGGTLDTNGKRTKKALEAAQRNTMNMSLNNMAPSVQAGYASYLEDGGDISLMEDGGELQTHWGGGAKPISYNPFLPDSGETIMFKGDSHDEGGIGMTYGGNKVEVEGGEPAVQLPEGDGVNLTVFGNLPITKEYAEILGDKSASGKKFKNYITEISKVEDKQNQLINKTSEELEALPVITSFDKLKLSTMEANLTGANMKLKMAADKKMNAAYLQNAINETADEHGLDAENLAKGKMKQAKCGTKMKKGQDGLELYYKTKGVAPGMIDYNKPNEQGNSIFQGANYESQWMPKVFKALGDPEISQRVISNLENYTGQDSADVRAAIAKGTNTPEKLAIVQRLATDRKVGPYHNLAVIDKAINDNANQPFPLNQLGEAPNTLEAITDINDPGYKRNKLMDIYNMVLPMIRPTDQEPLDPSQLYGEMYAMSNNQVDPVQAQTYQPDLNTPYDISYQDQLNANQADYRNVERLVGSNPAALSILNANKYSANEKVLGEQFRQNQATKDRVYGDNRRLLNDAKLKNLDIFDRQYVRQSQAVSNTKATTQAALNSISDKYAKNKLENRTLGIYENTYNYRYDDNGRAINYNGLFQANIPQAGADARTPIPGPNGTTLYPQYKNGKFLGYMPQARATTTAEHPEYATPPYVPIDSRKKGKDGMNIKGYSLIKSIKDL